MKQALPKRTDKTGSLAQSQLFGPLGRDACQALAGVASWRSDDAADDAFLFQLGDESTSLFLLTPGMGTGPGVHVQFGGSAASAVGFRLGEGELAGDVEFLLAGLAAPLPRRITSARLLRGVGVLALPAASIAKLAAEAPEFRKRLVRQAAGRLAGIAAHQAENRALHPEVRFSSRLLDQLDDFGHRAGNKGVFDRKLTQQVLADNLGMSRRQLSMHFSDWSARGLVETIPLALPDIARVERIADLAPPDLAGKLRAIIELIDEQIAGGLLAKASQTATDLLNVFPGNPLVSYQLALVSARLGAREQARAILGTPALTWRNSIADLKERLRLAWRVSLGLDPDDDGDDESDSHRLDAILAERLAVLAVDIGALHARLGKDVLAIMAPGDPAVREARNAARLYREVFDLSPNHYCAVNAAMLSLLGGEADHAETLARHALRLAARDGQGYWALASLAEASLVLGERDEARRRFAAAAAAADVDLAKITATRRQLALAKMFGGLDTTAEMAALDPGEAVCFSGSLITAADGTPDELAQAEQSIAAALRAWLAGRRIAAVHMSLACGADIIFAELALEAEIPLQVTLPFTVDRFREASVAIGNGTAITTDWEKRYFNCLDKAATVTELWKHAVTDTEREFHFLNANRHLMGEAMLSAAALYTRPRMLAVVHPEAARTKAGARRAVDEFCARGFQADVIEAPLRRKPPRGEKTAADPFAPVVFAFARSEQANPEVRRMLGEAGFSVRLLKDRRVAGHRMAAGFGEAQYLASRLSAGTDPRDPLLRVVCDFGPVRGRHGGAVAEDVLKLAGAGDLTAVAVGNVFATPAFVMPAVAAGDDPLRYTMANVALVGEAPRGARQIYKVRETG